MAEEQAITVIIQSLVSFLYDPTAPPSGNSVSIILSWSVTIMGLSSTFTMDEQLHFPGIVIYKTALLPTARDIRVDDQNIVF